MYGYIDFSEDLSIHYYSNGHGQPILFVPGWTMTINAFRKNLPVLAKNFHVFALDLRSQGKTTKLSSGNSYSQHGQDLAVFIQAVGIRNVILAGWSTGVLSIYAYLEQFGFDNVSGFISIDMSPKPMKDNDDDWGSASKPMIEQIQASIMSPDQSAFIREFAATHFLMEQAEDIFLDEIVAQSMNTPATVAASLFADGNLCDYSAIARKTAEKMPVLHIVSESNAGAAQKWISNNTPNVEVQILGSHMMFWEYPDLFNQSVTRFVSSTTNHST